MAFLQLAPDLNDEEFEEQFLTARAEIFAYTQDLLTAAVRDSNCVQMLWRFRLRDGLTRGPPAESLLSHRPHRRWSLKTPDSNSRLIDPPSAMPSTDHGGWQVHNDSSLLLDESLRAVVELNARLPNTYGALMMMQVAGGAPACEFQGPFSNPCWIPSSSVLKSLLKPHLQARTSRRRRSCARCGRASRGPCACPPPT